MTEEAVMERPEVEAKPVGDAAPQASKKQQRRTDPSWLMQWKQDVDATHIIESLELKSFPLRAVFEKRKTFDFVNFCLHHILVRWAYRMGEEGLNVMQQEIENLIGKVDKEFDKALRQQDALRNGKNISLAANNSPATLEAFVTNPLSMRYLNLFRKADEVILGFDSLWMYGLIDRGHSTKGMIAVRRQLNGIAMGIYLLYRRARSAERRAGNGATEAVAANSDLPIDAGIDDSAEITAVAAEKPAPRKRATKPALAEDEHDNAELAAAAVA